MSFEGVPWFVAGGAVHSADIARMLSYIAANGNDGVISGPDCRVTQTSVPGSTVQILPGAVAIYNKGPGAQYQMYLGRNTVADAVALAATGASPRSDLIVVRVEDPYYPGTGYPVPSNPAAGPYIFSRVISGVPSSTTKLSQIDATMSGIALARVDIPASTGTFTNSMIKDLREVAMPNLAQEEDNGSCDNVTPFPLTSSGYTQWPSTLSYTWFVPSWATRANVHICLTGVNVRTSSCSGNIRFKFGSITGQTIEYDTVWLSGDSRRDTFILSGRIDIPASMRGTNVNLYTEALRSSGSGRLECNRGTSFTAKVTFEKRPSWD